MPSRKWCSLDDRELEGIHKHKKSRVKRYSMRKQQGVLWQNPKNLHPTKLKGVF